MLSETIKTEQNFFLGEQMDLFTVVLFGLLKNRT